MFELIDNFSLCPKVSLKDLLFRMRKQKKSTSGKSSQFNETFEKNCMLCVGWQLDMSGKNLVRRNH